MKAIIADDESLIRSSLVSMLNELDIRVDIVGEARNGEELIRMVAENPPDLAFVDIRMPKLNGLEAIARLKEDTPGTQWIILTGFSDFSYAQAAIRLGAINYLLKPVTPEQLAEAVREADDRCRRRYEDANRQFEHSLLSLVHGSRTEETAAGMAAADPMPGYRFTATLFPLHSPVSPALLREVASSIPVCRDIRFASAVLPTGRQGHFLAWDARLGTNGEPAKSAYRRRLEDALAEACGGEPAVSALQTGICGSLLELIGQMAELERLSPLCCAAPLGNVATLAELSQANRTVGLLPLAERVEGLCLPFNERDILQYTKAHKQLKDAFAADLFRHEATVRSVSAYLRRCIGFMPDRAAFGDREAWFGQLLAHGERSLAKRSGEERLQGDWVEQVIRYVDHSYMNEIGIGQIAAELNVTPNYLSSLFHKKKGVTFVKYLTEIRMLKAKELLLANPSMKVQTIAEEVGYHSVRHFTKTFTDYYGLYPSEAREKYK